MAGVSAVVEYFHREELPGKRFFRCDPMRANLSTDACASMWRGANGGSEPREACLRCHVGALHAGASDANLSPLHLGLICARCHNPAQRLIGKMVCVSCKNREYEYLRGRNAKGTTPVKLRSLCRRRIRYLVGGEARSLVVQNSVDTEELVIAVLRDSPTRVSFGFGCGTPIHRQLRLF